MPLLSTFSFHSFSLLISSSSVSAITAKSSAYSENRLYTREFKLQITKSDRQHSWHQCQVTVYIHKQHELSASGHLAVKKVKVAHTRLPSVGFSSWSRFSAVNLQVRWVINPAVGHYFPPGLQLPPQPLRGLLPILLLGEHWHVGCVRLLPDSVAAAIWTRALLHLSTAR